MHDKLLDSIIDEYQIVRFTETNYILEDGQKLSRHKFRDEIFPKDSGTLGTEHYKRDPSFFDKISGDSVENRRKIKQRFFEDLEEIIKDTARSKVVKVDINKLDKMAIVHESFSFRDYILLRNIKQDRYLGKKVLFNTELGKITNISPDVYLDSLRADEKAEFRPFDAIFEYDPYNIAPISKVVYLAQETNRVNTYIAPEWRKLNIDVSNKPPAIFSKFLKHLFPDTESRRFFLSWLKNAILHRNETILVLNGAKGAGKNVLVDFMKELVGAENFGRAKQSLISKEFNAVLEDKRLIVLDELKISKKEHTFLKEACNPEHNIEKKGVDANNLTPTYFSIVILNNDVADNYLEHDDRRFSTVNITDIILRKSFTKEEIKELVDLFKNPAAIKQIGEFVIAYHHDAYSDPFYAFKPEKFHSLVYTSLSGWKQLIVSYFMASEKKINIAHMREDAKESGVLFPATNTKIESFLQNYLHRSEFRVGFISKDGRKSYIEMHEEFAHYLSNNTTITSSDEDDI